MPAGHPRGGELMYCKERTVQDTARGHTAVGHSLLQLAGRLQQQLGSEARTDDASLQVWGLIWPGLLKPKLLRKKLQR